MKKYPSETHGAALIAALCFATLLASCEQPKKNATPPAKITTTETGITAETAAAQPQATTKDSDKTPSPTAADMVALSNAMHGAASQQSDDAPKDQYGEPYIIGTLGGVPVNLPSSVVRFVEYMDSPGWDMEKSAAITRRHAITSLSSSPLILLSATAMVRSMMKINAIWSSNTVLNSQQGATTGSG